MAPPTVEAMRRDLQSIVNKTIPTTESKAKTTFISLPQELRDHVYSFLPLQTDHRIVIEGGIQDKPIPLVMRLSRTCRTVREDMQIAFWSNHKFIYHVYSGEIPELPPQPWTMAGLSRIVDLELQFVPWLWPAHWFWSAHSPDGCVHLLKKDGVWRVQFRFCTAVGYHCRGPSAAQTARVRTEDPLKQEREANLAAKAMPFLEGARRELQDNGCITPRALQILGEMRAAS